MAYRISTGSVHEMWLARLASRGEFNENSKPAEPVEASGPLEARTLGATIPFVIGTGQVDGKFFIGGTSVISEITGYEDSSISTRPSAWELFLDSFTSYGSSGSGGRTYKVSAPSYPLFGMRERPVERTPIRTTRTVASCGYILAYDPFERGYDLIKLEVDGNIVYDTENGIGASTTFRFYGGQHTTVDPILTDIIGANAGPYKNFVMVFLDGYPSDNPPSLRAVISNAATDQPDTEEIAWTGTAPSQLFQNTAGRMAAYDPIEGLIYQLLTQFEVPSLDSIYLVVLDTNTHQERYRVPLADTSDYADRAQWIMAIRGSGHVLVRLAHPSFPEVNRVYSATTGAIVAEYVEVAGVQNFRWDIGSEFGNKWLFIGADLGSPGGAIYGLVDLAFGTLTIGSIGISPTTDPTYGRRLNGTVSFFFENGLGNVSEAIFDGEVWRSATAYTSSSIVTGIWFDPLTGYLVVCESSGPSNTIRYVNPDTGAQIDVIPNLSNLYWVQTGGSATGKERYWPKPGYAMFTDGLFEDGKVYLLDIREKTISTFAEDDSVTVQNFTTGIFDQNKSAYYTGYDDDVWTEHALPNTAPGLIDLEDIVTDVMSLAGYAPAHMVFESFAGLESKK